MTEGGTSIWQIDTNDHGSDTLDKFADAYKDGDISPRNEFAFAGRYSCGKAALQPNGKQSLTSIRTA